jgi:hypothetical protein
MRLYHFNSGFKAGEYPCYLFFFWICERCELAILVQARYREGQR